MLTVPELIKQISKNIPRINAATARKECYKTGSMTIDVREADEVMQRSVTGSINIPRGVLEMKILALDLEAATPIYIHCATGARATLAAEQLIRIGYSNVTVIDAALDEILREQDIKIS